MEEGEFVLELEMTLFCIGTEHNLFWEGVAMHFFFWGGVACLPMQGSKIMSLARHGHTNARNPGAWPCFQFEDRYRPSMSDATELFGVRCLMCGDGCGKWLWRGLRCGVVRGPASRLGVKWPFVCCRLAGSPLSASRFATHPLSRSLLLLFKSRFA